MARDERKAAVDFDGPATEIAGTIQKIDPLSIAKEPNSHFTGPVDLRRLPANGDEARLAHVTFSVGAQTQWHHHDGPQWLLFTDGYGEVATRAGKGLSCRAGDLVRVDRDVSHRHGAAAGHTAAHIAVTMGETCWEDDC